MIGTIAPLVQEAKARAHLRVVIHVVGSTVGGIVLGSVLAGLGQIALPLSPPWRNAVLVLVGAWAVAWHLGSTRWKLPEHRWSVPRGLWHMWNREIVSLLYGFGMGLGALTHIRFASFHLMAVWVVLTADPLVSVLVGTVYGFARGLAVVVVASDVQASTRPGDRARAIQSSLVGRSRQLALVNAFASFVAIGVWAGSWLVAIE